MRLQATRIRPGAYQLEAFGLEFTITRAGSRKWLVRERSERWDADCTSKRAAMKHIQRAGEAMAEEAAEAARQREERLANTGIEFAWLAGFGLCSPAARGENLRAVFPEARPVWIAQARGDAEVIDLITWRGKPGDLDTVTLDELGGSVVSTGRHVPGGYR